MQVAGRGRKTARMNLAVEMGNLESQIGDFPKRVVALEAKK